MKSSIISGLIGGLVSITVLTFSSAKLRDQSTDGRLQWGWGLIPLGALCLAIAGLAFGAFFYDRDVWTDRGEFIAVVGLVLGFGAGAVYCLAEYFLVRGKYDSLGVEFYTPWTGAKAEQWKDLESVTFNAQMSWYVLTFRSGQTIRLSNMLSGHGGVIHMLSELGFDIR